MFQVFREVKVKGFDASQYEAKQIFYTSRDGTKVPMFIVSKKVSHSFIIIIILLAYYCLTDEQGFLIQRRHEH